MSEMMSLNISQDLIKSAIQEEVKAGIIRALGDPSKIVKDAIASMTDTYVDVNGNITKIGSYRSKPYFDWLAEETVKKTVREEIEKYVNEHREEFANVIRMELGKKTFRNNMAAEFIKTITEAIHRDYKMPITISFNELKDY